MTHQMWPNHPFSQRDKKTERPLGVVVEGDRKVGSTKFRKEEGG